MITTLSRHAARPQEADPAPAPDQAPLPKREPGKTLTGAITLTALGSYLRGLVADADVSIPTGRRTPRTDQESRVRINVQQGQPCGPCNGAGGTTETTNEGGVLRQTWRTCSSCNGSGAR